MGEEAMNGGRTNQVFLRLVSISERTGDLSLLGRNLPNEKRGVMSSVIVILHPHRAYLPKVVSRHICGLTKVSWKHLYFPTN